MNLPVVKTAELNAFSSTKYMVGMPRQYRFDAGKGQLNLNGDETVTKKGAPFSFVPIAYRIFKDDLFNMGRKDWAEFFFIDSKGAVASVMFHGYSVEHFLKMSTSELFYADLKVTEVKITVTPIERESKKLDESGKPNKYFIARFNQEAAGQDYLKAVGELLKDVPNIYRKDTLKTSNEIAVSENFPLHILEAMRAREVKQGQEVEVEAV